MRQVCATRIKRYLPMTRSQDKIGWQRFIEGMLSKEIVLLQRECTAVYGIKLSLQA